MPARSSWTAWGPGTRRSERANGRPRALVAVVKCLLVGLLVAGIAGVEFLHELSSGDEPGAAVCTAPQASQEAFRDLLVQHLQSHR